MQSSQSPKRRVIGISDTALMCNTHILVQPKSHFSLGGYCGKDLLSAVYQANSSILRAYSFFARLKNNSLGTVTFYSLAPY